MGVTRSLKLAVTGEKVNLLYMLTLQQWQSRILLDLGPCGAIVVASLCE